MSMCPVPPPQDSVPKCSGPAPSTRTDRLHTRGTAGVPPTGTPTPHPPQPSAYNLSWDSRDFGETPAHTHLGPTRDSCRFGGCCTLFPNLHPALADLCPGGAAFSAPRVCVCRCPPVASSLGPPQASLSSALSPSWCRTLLFPVAERAPRTLGTVQMKPEKSVYCRTGTPPQGSSLMGLSSPPPTLDCLLALRCPPPPLDPTVKAETGWQSSVLAAPGIRLGSWA